MTRRRCKCRGASSGATMTIAATSIERYSDRLQHEDAALSGNSRASYNQNIERHASIAAKKDGRCPSARYNCQ